MKKNLFFMALAMSVNASAQFCPRYVCNNPVTVSPAIANQNYNGDQCFTGNGTIPNSTNWNNWNAISFSGDLHVVQSINFQNGPKKVYIGPGSTIQLSSISMDNNDTIFNRGNLTINNYTSNNSFTNVIVNGTGATLKINGTFYNSPTIINTTPGNPTNVLVITSCSYNPLPVTLQYFQYAGGKVKWQFSMVDNVESVSLQSSGDGKAWNNVDTYRFNVANEEYNHTAAALLYRLRIDNTNGSINYSQIVGKVPAFLPDQDVRITTMDGRLLLQGKMDISKLPKGQVLLLKIGTSVQQIQIDN